MRFKGQITIFLGLIILVQAIFSAPVSASYCDSTGNGGGRTACHGYFTNGSSSASVGTVFNVVSSGIYPSLTVAGGAPRSLGSQANSFETIVSNYLNGADTSDAIGAAFIIANMMGKSGTFFDSGAYQNTAGGVQWAKDNFATWNTLVDQYAAAGRVDFSISTTFGSAYRNSAYFSDIKDDAFHEHTAETITTITFTNPDGSVFRIQKSCGNLVGGLGPLVSLDSWTASATSAATVAGVAVTYVKRGQVVTWTHKVTTVGSGSAPESGYLRWTVYPGKPANVFVKTLTTSAPGSLDYNTAIGSPGTYTYASGAPNNTPKTFTIPAGAADGDKYCQQITFSNLAWNNSGNGNSAADCVTVEVPLPLSLTPIATGLTDYEAGSGVAKTASHSVQVTPPCDRTLPIPGAAVSVTWTIGGTDGGVNGNQTLSYTNCQAAFTTPVITTSIPAVTLDTKSPGYLFTRTTTVGAASATTSGIVVTVPYARFFGNDIYACGGSGLVPTLDGRIIFNVSNIDTSKGAAAQYAALALSGFGTAPDGTITAGQRGSIADGSKSPCNINVTSYLPTTSTPLPGGNSIPNIAGYYSDNGSRSFNNASISTKVTVYINGDIDILQDLGTVGSPPTPFVDNNSVPYLLLIATGNIYIHSNVNTVNAVLVAGGTISTCSTGSLASPATAALGSICNSPLTINGAMQAKNILFRRAVGTRLLNDTPAEKVVFPPYLHFATPFLDDTSKKSFQSLLNAPPYL